MRMVQADEGGAIRAANVLREGGVLVFPTETVYGIGVLWGRIPAIELMRQIKGREENKPFQLLIPSAAHAGLYAEVSEQAQAIMDRWFPGPLTLVLPDGRGGTAGLRMPAHPWLQMLLARLDSAIVASSANRSGQSPAVTAQEAAAALGEDVPLIIDGGPAQTGRASTVASLLDGELKILREGAVTQDQLLDAMAGA